MRIRWTPAAADDLQHIFDYLRETNPNLARHSYRNSEGRSLAEASSASRKARP
jgi:plasmid stabilization system protein ParE